MKKNIFKTILSSSGVIKLMGRKGILRLPSGNVLEITLDTSGTYRHYTRLVGRIVNSKDGEISVNSFYFRDFLNTSSRVDSRPDYQDDFYIWEQSDGDMDWYIARPDADEVMEMVLEIVKWAQIYEPK